MSEHKTAKYFKYALGEIVLVMVGILLALQVNNWNEDQKNERKKEVYLQDIYKDMEMNIAEIEEDIDNNNVVIAACDSLLTMANNGTYYNIGEEALFGLIVKLGDYSLLQLEQGTLQEILNSGTLQIFTNKEIRNSIVDWERKFIGVREMERFGRDGMNQYFQKLNEFIPTYKIGYNTKEGDYTNILSSAIRKQYFNDISLLNTIGSIRFVAETLNALYTDKIAEIVHFNSLIKKELGDDLLITK